MSDLLTSPQFHQTTHFAPPGMIPEFNELGNHPTDMYSYMQTHVNAAYNRVGLSPRYDEAEALCFAAIDDLSSRPDEFTGHHLPSDATRALYEHFSQSFVDLDACSWTGSEHYQEALTLQAAGHNVILAPNHTSPLDGLVPFKLFSRDFPGTQPPALVMSQVFEYARVTRLMTSGVEKFPVFQPKHIRRFGEAGCTEAATQMHRQNAVTLKALRTEAAAGQRQVFLYLERDRNSGAMGVPEPAVSRVLDMLERARQGTFILPMHISGIGSIFPNRPGHNEMDEFFETIQIGSGAVACGKPVRYSRIVDEVERISPPKIAEAALGAEAAAALDPQKARLAGISIATLGLVARQAPSVAARGLYGHELVAEIAEQLSV